MTKKKFSPYLNNFDFVGAGSGIAYVLPIASGSVLGGIKIGSRLTIDANGVLSADVQGGGGGQVNSVGAGTGISVNSTDPVNPVVTNTAPDQTVAITDSGIATVTGTYPNFNIDVPATDISGKVNTNQGTPQTITGRQIQQDGIQLGLTPTVGAHSTGKTYRDATWKTPACELEDTVILQIGQETMAYVYNGTASTLTQGQVVYTAGTQAGVPSVDLAKGDADSTSQVLGVITSTSILAGAYGYCTIRGHVNNIDTSAWNLNDNLYLDASVAGALTNVKPNTGTYDTRVGRVMLKDASTGRVYVNQVREYAMQTAPAGGTGVELFPDDTSITATGTNNAYPIKVLSKVPVTTAEDVDTITCNNNTVMYGTYLNTDTIGKTTIDGGVWVFDLYAGVSSATNVTSLGVNVNRVRPGTGTMTTTGTGTTRTATASTGTPFAVAKIDVGGTIDSDSFLQTPQGLYRILSRTSDTVITIETLTTYTNEVGVAYSTHKKLFGVTTGEINNVATSPLFTGLQLYSVTTAQPAFTVESTDTLASAFFATTNATASRSVYFSHNGTTRYSHFSTPLLVKHNNLPGLNEADYQHLTAAQLAIVNATSNTNTGDETQATIKTKLGAATASVDGYATAAQITKLDGIAAGATANTKATGAEVDTGTDDVKFVTSKAMEDSSYTKSALPLAGGTMTGDITLGENTSLAQDPVLSADGKYTGTTITGTAGATLAFGDLIYLDPTDSRRELADANIAAGSDGDARGILGICVLAATGDGEPTKILLDGVVRADTTFPTLTINAPVYVGETAGDIVVTQPTTTDVVIRIVGYGLTADSIFFRPSYDYITHT